VFGVISADLDAGEAGVAEQAPHLVLLVVALGKIDDKVAGLDGLNRL
jgi:hypothetical protein